MAEFMALSPLQRPLVRYSELDPQCIPQIPKLSVKPFQVLWSAALYLTIYTCTDMWFREREKYADHFNKYGILHLASI